MPLQSHNTYYDSANPTSGVYYYDELGNLLPLTIDKICHPGFGITFSANAIIATGSSSGSGGGSAYSPTVLIQDAGTPQGHPQGGTKVTITDINHQSGQEFYVWNGNNGTVMNLKEGSGIQITHETGTTNYTIGVSADYATKPTEVNKIFVYQTTGTTTSGWEAIPIEYDVAKRNFAIGAENKFVSAGGGNNILLQGYQNSGSYVDFAQGYQNSAYQYGISQGYQNIANYESMAQGYINTAVNISLAQGSTNSANYQAFAQGILNRAYYDSLAQGHRNSAVDQSFAQGLENTAYHYSFAQGYDNIAYMQSFAQGANNIASNYSQAIGHNLIASGFKVDDYDYGLFAIGGYNATTSNALFVIGNGNSYNGTPSRSDAFVVYQDGHVSAAGDIWANGVKLGAGGGIVGPTGTGVEDKYWLYSTYIGNSWIEANTWLCNNFICENGISGIPDMSLGKMHIGLSGDYLPTSGGTVSGQLEVHGGSNFDYQFIKLTREGNSCGARIGLGSDTTNGTLALKSFNAQGQNTVQVNIKYNANNNELIQVQKGGADVGFLIPAQVHQGSYTPTSDDGILHIVLES